MSVVSKTLHLLRERCGLTLSLVMARPLADDACARHKHDYLAYSVMQERELYEWCEDPALELAPHQVRTALRRRDVCVGVTDAGRPVGYLWYAFGSAPHDGRIRVAFAANARYAYRAFIRPDYRGRGISHEMYARAAATCPRRGRQVGISFILMDNTPSIRAAKRSGWRTVGYAGYLECFGVVLPFRSTGARHSGFSFYTERRNALAAAEVAAG